MVRRIPSWLIEFVLFLSASLGGTWLLAPAFGIAELSGILFAWAGIFLIWALLLALDQVRPGKRAPQSVRACLVAAAALLIGGTAPLVDGTPRVLAILAGAILFIASWIVDRMAADDAPGNDSPAG